VRVHSSHADRYYTIQENLARIILKQWLLSPLSLLSSHSIGQALLVLRRVPISILPGTSFVVGAVPLHRLCISTCLILSYVSQVVSSCIFLRLRCALPPARDAGLSNQPCTFQRHEPVWACVSHIVKPCNVRLFATQSYCPYCECVSRLRKCSIACLFFATVVC